MAEVELSPEERARYVGAYQTKEPDDDAFEAFRVWEEGGRLHIGIGRSGAKADKRFHLVPLGGGDRFILGRYNESNLQSIDPDYELRFVVREGVANALEILKKDQFLSSAQRIL
ncbi:MAG TPA: hypothetical protein VMP01_10775 [Pirellulaceae bacterium]|nr:hypothetical protein [Pirellulaceae bacterium]